jgi:hypothetical protein
MISAVFGAQAEGAILLARGPDPEIDWTGDLSALKPPPERTAILSLAGGRARFKEWLHRDLWAAWRSPNGATYCTATRGEMMVLSDGKWRSERVVDDEDEKLTWVTGFGGATEPEDWLLAFGGTRAFCRRGGAWNELELPDDADMLGKAAGRSPNEMYILSEGGILLWDGKTVTPAEGPNDQFMGILARPNGDLVVTGKKGLHHWSEAAGKWSRHKAPAKLRSAILERGGVVFLATEEGILSWNGSTFEFELKGADLNGLSPVGDDLFAKGADEGVFLRRGPEWVPVPVPFSILPEEAS